MAALFEFTFIRRKVLARFLNIFFVKRKDFWCRIVMRNLYRNIKNPLLSNIVFNELIYNDLSAMKHDFSNKIIELDQNIKWLRFQRLQHIDPLII